MHQPVQDLMSLHQIEPSRIAYLLQQGIELERLRLQMYRVIEANSVESHITILEGDRFLALIDPQEPESNH